MPDPQSTQPATTPDRPVDYYSPTDLERLNKLPPDELKAEITKRVDYNRAQGNNTYDFVSFPKKYKELEDKINAIIGPKMVSEPVPAEETVPAEDTKVNPSDQFQLQSDPSTTDVNNVAKAADPVNLANGNFVYSSTDFHTNGAGMDFIFVRTYSQLAIYAGPLGHNWDHSYNLWLRVEHDTQTLYRSTGALREETFRRHEQHGYWIPPDGAHGVIMENGDSFILRLPDGARIIYQPHPILHPAIHVVAKIEDRFGNYLDFLYSEGQLTRVRVNHPDRTLDLHYDTRNRIVSIRDFSGRVWTYDYDDLGNLVAVTTPATPQYKRGLTTRYEYTGALTSDRYLQHNLISIIDAAGQIYLENEYGTQPNLLSYGRVVRQRQGNGDVIFEYADVVEDFDFLYEDKERPTHQTIVTDRDGKQTRYLINRFGNIVFKEEYARIDGLPKLVSSHFRYNKDGNLIGMISPLGVITQTLYGRDIYERRFPPGNDYRPETDPNLTREARLQFDNLLAVVKRGRYHDINSLNLARGLWSADIFPDILQADHDDIIQKFAYESEFSQPLTVSDPRFTQSADPTFSEDGEYHRRLTKYSYRPGNGFQHLFLNTAELPTPVLPDGTASSPIKTQFAQYDAKGRIVRTVAANGLTTLHTYAQAADGPLEGFLMTTTIDPGGLEIKQGVERDQLGRVVKSFRPQFFDFADDRFFSTSEYNDLSQIIRSTSTAPFSIDTRNSFDRIGNISRSEINLKDSANSTVGTLAIDNRYDEEFNLISKKVGDSRAAKKTKVIFDRASRPCLSIAASGRKRKTLFNERGLLSKRIEDYGGVHSLTRGYYDADGRLVRLIGPRGFATTYIYDARGRPIDTADAQGNRTIRYYDKTGNVLAECVYEKTGENAFVLRFRREFAYDEIGRMIVSGVNKFEQVPAIPGQQLSSAFREAGPGGLLATKFFYNTVGNLVKQEDQDGRQFVSEFDILGRATGMIDPNGNEVRFKYDKEANVLRIDRQEVTRDPATNAVTGSRHFAETLAYDELNRLVERKTPIGATRYRYDSRGNRVEIEDPLGNKVNNTFDIFSRLTGSTQSFHRYNPSDVPERVSVTFAYDLDDQKVAQTDALRRTTLFRYDSAGRLISTVLPDGSADAIQYDSSWNITEYRDRNGLIKNLVWDELDRNIRLRIDTSALAADVVLESATDYSAEYDALGRFKRVRNDFVTNSFSYNSLNHLTEENTSFSSMTGINPANRYTIRRAFSNTGALIALTYPSGRVITYTRDILDRIVKIQQAHKGNDYPGDPVTPDNLTIADIEYDGRQTKRVSRPNGTVTEFKYDFGSRTVEIAHTSGSSKVLTLQFLYDALGNIRQKIELGEDFQSTQNFRYDSLSRLYERSLSATATLIDVSSLAPPSAPLPDDLPNLQSKVDPLVSSPNPLENAGYNYDLAGNRTSKTLNGTTDSYETNSLDQYTRINAVHYRYDRNGNLAEDNAFRYGYDHRNQLSKVTNKSDSTQITFFLDYFGRRCGESPSKIFLYDDHKLLEQHDDGLLSRSIVAGASQDEILLSSGGAREHYLLADLGRSVRYLFDSGVKLNFYVYDEFGNLQQSLLSADDNPFRFAGKRFLGNSGKYDFFFRTYDPTAGRFIQRDPTGFADGTNLYGFLRNNPLVFSDPLGLESRPENGTLAGLDRVGGVSRPQIPIFPPFNASSINNVWIYQGERAPDITIPESGYERARVWPPLRPWYMLGDEEAWWPKEDWVGENEGSGLLEKAHEGAEVVGNVQIPVEQTLEATESHGLLKFLKGPGRFIHGVNAGIGLYEFYKHPSVETGIPAGLAVVEFVFPNPVTLAANIGWHGTMLYAEAVTEDPYGGHPSRRERWLRRERIEAWRAYHRWQKEMALKRQAAADAALYRSLSSGPVGAPRWPRPDLSEVSVAAQNFAYRMNRPDVDVDPASVPRYNVFVDLQYRIWSLHEPGEPGPW